MRALTLLMFYGYASVLVLVGAFGIVMADWELAVLYGFSGADQDPTVRATLLNQYRFLKAMELSCGVYLFLFRRAIFRRPTHYYLFLLIIFGGGAARVLSIVVDGWPTWPFIAFAGAELATGVLVVLHVRRNETLMIPSD